jgi:hypothetical protein
MTLVFSDRGLIERDCKIVWSDGSDVAVEFIGIPMIGCIWSVEPFAAAELLILGFLTLIRPPALPGDI